ncbi:MAG: hypothetical protein WD049_01615 [Candidatus Paceibacterota bacterium]
MQLNSQVTNELSAMDHATLTGGFYLQLQSFESLHRFQLAGHFTTRQDAQYSRSTGTKPPMVH